MTCMLPLPPQNYPLHSTEVNGFHTAPTTYNHTPTLNGESIMGKHQERLAGTFPLSRRSNEGLIFLSGRPRHHSQQLGGRDREGAGLGNPPFRLTHQHIHDHGS